MASQDKIMAKQMGGLNMGTDYNKGYGSLDKYKLCSHDNKNKSNGSFFKLIVCILFFSACLYFALVLGANAQTTTNAKIKITKKNENIFLEGSKISNTVSNDSSVSPVLKASERLPLLQRRTPADRSRFQNQNRQAIKKKPDMQKAKAALMLLSMIGGARYVLAAPQNHAKTRPPLPAHKPARDVRIGAEGFALTQGAVQKRASGSSGKYGVLRDRLSPHSMSVGF